MAHRFAVPWTLRHPRLSSNSKTSVVATSATWFQALTQVSARGWVLGELLRVGSVVYWDDTHFRTISRAFVASGPMSREQIEYFRDSLTRLAKTLEHNLNPGNAAKRLERFVVAARGLPEELLPNSSPSRDIEPSCFSPTWVTGLHPTLVPKLTTCGQGSVLA